MITYFRKKLLILPLLFSVTLSFAQVGIGTNTPDSSSVLEIKSTTKGVLIPRLSNTEVATLTGKSPTQGLLIYNTNKKCIQIYTGTTFQCLVTGTATDTTKDAWVNDSANSMVKLGTKSNDVAARDTGSEFVVKDDGKVGIGTSAPQGALHIHTINSNDVILSKASNTGSEDMDIDLVRLRYSGSTFLVPQNGDALGGLRYKSFTGSAALFNINAEITSYADGTITSTSNPGMMSLKTTPVGSLNAVERIVIKNDGKVGIGIISPDSNAILDVTSTSKGVLLPRIILDSLTRTAPLSGAKDGMLVYSNGGKLPDGFYYWESGRWHNIGEKSKVLHGVASAGGTNNATAGAGTITIPANTDRMLLSNGDYVGTVVLPTATNSDAANRINDIISITRKSTNSVSVSTANTDMTSALSIGLNQTAYFIYDGYKWAFLKLSN